MNFLDKCYYCLFCAAERSQLKDSAMEAAAMFLPAAIFLNLLLIFSIGTRLSPFFHFPHDGKPAVYALLMSGMILSYFRYCRKQNGRLIAKKMRGAIDPHSGAFWGKVIFFESILSPFPMALYYVIKVPFPK